MIGSAIGIGALSVDDATGNFTYSAGVSLTDFCWWQDHQLYIRF